MSRPRSSWHRTASRPVGIWLVVLVLASLVHPFLPNSSWVMLHLFTLGAVTTSVLIWSQHFTEKFLHNPLSESARGPILTRIYVLTSGILVTMIGQLGSAWPVTAVGAAIVGGAVLWHSLDLYAQYRDSDHGQRFAPAVLGYVLACALLPLGGAIGALLAADIGPQDTLHTVHVLLNICGFLGLSAYASLTLLFPTIWRAQSAGEHIFLVLGLQVAGIFLACAGAFDGLVLVLRLGLGLYLVGWLVALRDFGAIVLKVLANPRDRVGFASVAVACAPLWLSGCLVYMIVHPLQIPVLPLAVGFAAQLLIGVMSFLLPSTIGGGPAAVRTGLYTLGAGGLFRATLLNVGLGAWLLTEHSVLKVLLSILVMFSLAAYIPLLRRTVKAQRAVIMRQSPGLESRPAPAWGQVTAALALIALLCAVVPQVNASLPVPAGSATAPAADAAATGETTRVEVSAGHMSFSPNLIEVPFGNRLEIVLRNDDPNVHDLKLATGPESGRLVTGQEVVIDAGVITAPVAGWCTIIGHKQQGMVLQIQPVQ